MYKVMQKIKQRFFISLMAICTLSVITTVCHPRMVDSNEKLVNEQQEIVYRHYDRKTQNS